MNGITHKKAKRYLLRNLDGLLTAAQQDVLEAHLAECAACRAEAESLSALTTRLQGGFHARWDAYDGPSRNVTMKFHSQTRRIIMFNKIKIGLSTTLGIAILVGLFFVFNAVFPLSSEIETVSNDPQTSDELSMSSDTQGLLAFTSAIEDGNLDIYTVRPDGSDLTNLTNNRAYDVHPVWSPDGERIAFESNRDGHFHIYVMNGDGSVPIQISASNGDDRLSNGTSSVWSPDGTKLLFVSFTETADIYMANIDGSGVMHLAEVNISPVLTPKIYWSPDGTKIAYVANDLQDPTLQRVYVMDVDGKKQINITSQLQSNENISETDIRWSSDGQSVFYLASLNRDGKTQWVVYQVDVSDNSLLEYARIDENVISWYEGGTVILLNRTKWTWLKPDGTSNTLEPFKECQGSDGRFAFEQSSKGYSVIGVSCQNGRWRIYEIDPNGTALQKLQESPIRAVNNLRFFWSPDDSYIAFNISSSGKTDLYILNLEAAINDPSVQPVQVLIGGGELPFHYLVPSWQPFLPEEQ